MFAATVCYSSQLRPLFPRQRPRWAPSGGSRQQRSNAHRAPVAAAQGGLEDNSRDGSSRRRGKLSSTAEPQPQLQAWLQQEQGLPAEAADQHARRLALVFGSQQAALDGLPAVFKWCRSRGLTGLQTAQLLDDIAKRSRKNVAQFTALVQPVWQLMDSYVAAWAEQQQQAGDKLRKRTSLAEALCSSSEEAKALAMPPGHAEAWRVVVGQHLSRAAIGRLLLTMPNVVCGCLDKGPATISWAVNVLGVADPAAFFAGAPTLLTRDMSTLQRNLDSLQQALGLTTEQARQLVVKQPNLLASNSGTVQAALAWLRQLFPDAAQLADVVDRGPALLSASTQRLQGNAGYLHQALGWRGGTCQLAALVAARPQNFATINLSDKDTQPKLRLLSEVVGVSIEDCLTGRISYLTRKLDSTAARYMLVQERAPELLYDCGGELYLSWVLNANKPHNLRRLGMSQDVFNACVRGWPASAEGRRLLAGLRAGSVAGWPRPPVPGEAQQQQRQEAAQRRQVRAERKQGTAAAMDGKRRGRGRPRKAQAGSGAAAAATAAEAVMAVEPSRSNGDV